MSRPLIIEVLLAGHAPDSIRHVHGDFDVWFAVGNSGHIRFQSTDLSAGEALPDPEASDGWIISGAAASVYDDIPWLAEVETGIAAAAGSGHPILGVCFGHQLLAQALGGRVTRNPAGWELGEVRAELTDEGQADPLMNGMPATFRAYASHQDAVVSLPPEALLLAENSAGVQSIKVGEKSYGVQFHPEFSLDIARAYTRYRRDQLRQEITWPEDGGNGSSRTLRNFISQIVEGAKDDTTAV